MTSAERVAREVYADQFGVVSAYVNALAGRGVERGLIGPREVDRLWDRHIMNSAAVVPLIGEGLTVLDAGSGAGLPGLPVAILRTDLRVILVESMLRRVTFLTEVVEELGLADRVEVRRTRVEEVRDTVDVVTCRAVASLDRLLGWTIPLFSPGGELLALKGSSAPDEVKAARPILRSHRLVADVVSSRIHPDAEPATIVRVVLG